MNLEPPYDVIRSLALTPRLQVVGCLVGWTPVGSRFVQRERSFSGGVRHFRLCFG